VKLDLMLPLSGFVKTNFIDHGVFPFSNVGITGSSSDTRQYAPDLWEYYLDRYGGELTTARTGKLGKPGHFKDRLAGDLE
jgi:hypothetical protein